MKKRMIAWLLCVCMTFTATPEMLFADVTAESQQTQEESSQGKNDPAETQTTEQENEKSDGTEKIETETAEETEMTETESTEKEETTETVSSEEEETTETEPTEETETLEETETEVPEETESTELTMEEQERIEQEVIDEISLFSAAGSYSLTEEQLYMLVPSYLNNKAYDDIIARCGDMSLDAINSVSATDETVASFMYSIKTGSSVL